VVSTERRRHISSISRLCHSRPAKSVDIGQYKLRSTSHRILWHAIGDSRWMEGRKEDVSRPSIVYCGWKELTNGCLVFGLLYMLLLLLLTLINLNGKSAVGDG
jgi:hypothetical protein